MIYLSTNLWVVWNLNIVALAWPDQKNLPWINHIVFIIGFKQNMLVIINFKNFYLSATRIFYHFKFEQSLSNFKKCIIFKLLSVFQFHKGSICAFLINYVKFVLLFIDISFIKKKKNKKINQYGKNFNINKLHLNKN